MTGDRRSWRDSTLRSASPPTLVDSSGNLYAVDASNNRIRKIAASSQIVTTIAGTGTHGFSGDGGPATSAAMKLSGDSPGELILGIPPGIAIDRAGNIYVSDTYNHRIRKIDAATGVIATVAGDGTKRFSGDGGPATAAGLQEPAGLTIDDKGDLYFADSSNLRIRRVSGANQNNLRIRMISATTGVITTIAGAGHFGSGFTGDGGPATQANLSYPLGIEVDQSGNLYIADTEANRVRAIFACVSVSTSQPLSPAEGASGLSTFPRLAWIRERFATMCCSIQSTLQSDWSLPISQQRHSRRPTSNR